MPVYRVSKRRASKRQASKRRASKRQASKRQVSKRQASKRQASKRQASKRQASKRQASKRRVSKIKVQKVNKDNKTYFHFYIHGSKMTYKEGIELLMSNGKNGHLFRKLVTKLLHDQPGPYRWKLTAINRKIDYERKDKYFKFTTIPSKLHIVQDPTKFEDKMKNDTYMISENFLYFKSPSGTSLLVPKNIANRDENSKNCYVHFSNFIKYAPRKQVEEYWFIFAKLIDEFFQKEDNNLLYINTSGMEVEWLHVRFDVKPDKIVWN